jgi:hypothetical protein
VFYQGGEEVDGRLEFDSENGWVGVVDWQSLRDEERSVSLWDDPIPYAPEWRPRIGETSSHSKPIYTFSPAGVTPARPMTSLEVSPRQLPSELILRQTGRSVVVAAQPSLGFESRGEVLIPQSSGGAPPAWMIERERPIGAPRG